jgi:phosphoribosylanthranilate isomerase
MDSMVRVKICGIRSAKDAESVSALGVHAIGLNFYEQSPRFLGPSAAEDVVRALGPLTSAVGVFVNTPVRRATAIAYQLGLRGIQTVQDQMTAEDTFPFSWIPTFRMKSSDSLQTIRDVVSGPIRPSAVLVDAYVPGEMGGTGRTVPWQLLEGFDCGVPLILAGGLTPDNVQEAIRIVKPWGVDVASGVESSPGVKDLGRVKAFLQAVESASLGN